MNLSPVPRHRPVGQILISRGVISEVQLRIALLEQMKANQPVGQLLVSLGFVSEATLRDTLSESMGHELIDLTRTIADPAALCLVPVELARRHNLFPLAYSTDPHCLTVAISDPDDEPIFDALRTLAAANSARELMIDVRMAGETEIVRAIDQHYGHELTIDGILGEIESAEIDYPALSAAPEDCGQPVARLVSALLADAFKQGASDIHFEPETGFLRIRLRIDGFLRQTRALHKSYWAAMALRIKLMSGMSITETRLAQDGRILLNIGRRQVDFHVSLQPTLHGENIVLHLIDRQKKVISLAEIGFDEPQLELIKLMMARPEGIILVSGPADSGKTATIYSMLDHINEEGRNIMTFDDAVEYPMAMIRQIAVPEAARADIAGGIRSMMRQNPGAILIGEMADIETAEMAFRAAMTGHQVFTTVQANSVVGAILRLLDMGIPPDFIAGNLIGIVSQRLVRKLCPNCKRPYPAEAHEQKMLGMTGRRPPPMLYRAAGCDQCDFQGYRGRVAILELLRMDGDLDELIARRGTSREFRSMALTKGYRPLVEDGLRRALDGSTSLEELSRVVDLTDRM